MRQSRGPLVRFCAWSQRVGWPRRSLSLGGRFTALRYFGDNATGSTLHTALHIYSKTGRLPLWQLGGSQATFRQIRSRHRCCRIDTSLCQPPSCKTRLILRGVLIIGGPNAGWETGIWDGPATAKEELEELVDPMWQKRYPISTSSKHWVVTVLAAARAA